MLTGLASGAAGLLMFRDHDGEAVALSAVDATARALPLMALSTAEATTLAALGETLVPGARAAGMAYYVDAQLAADPADGLLMLRYMDIAPPWLPFYRAGLAALDRLAGGAGFAALADPARSEMVRAMATGVPDRWSGPPAPLFYFVTRADAIDVVWGTQTGFAALGVPYLDHIAPDTPW